MLHTQSFILDQDSIHKTRYLFNNKQPQGKYRYPVKNYLKVYRHIQRLWNRSYKHSVIFSIKIEENTTCTELIFTTQIIFFFQNRWRTNIQTRERFLLLILFKNLVLEKNNGASLLTLRLVVFICSIHI